MASFEEQLAELEKVVERLEQGDLTLEESVSLYERGAVLSRGCRAQISNAESRIQALVEPEEDGPVRVEELEVAEGEEEMGEEDGEGYDDGRL